MQLLEMNVSFVGKNVCLQQLTMVVDRGVLINFYSQGLMKDNICYCYGII